MIKAVIFDLDNTLYNFDAANESGIRALAAYTEPVFGWDFAKTRDMYETKYGVPQDASKSGI